MARRATAAELPRLAQVLTAAFGEDPVFRHLFPPGMRVRRQRMGWSFRRDLARSRRGDGAWATADGRGAAIWFPPGGWNTSPAQNLLALPAYVAILGRRLAAAERLRAVMIKHHPAEPHWYLYAIGALPGHQGRGIGTALLQPVLDMCDRNRVPAYLEASTDRNRALYLRHGFHDHGEPLTLPDGGPVLYPMWRDRALPPAGSR